MEDVTFLKTNASAAAKELGINKAPGEHPSMLAMHPRSSPPTYLPALHRKWSLVLLSLPPPPACSGFALVRNHAGHPSVEVLFDGHAAAKAEGTLAERLENFLFEEKLPDYLTYDMDKLEDLQAAAVSVPIGYHVSTTPELIGRVPYGLCSASASVHARLGVERYSTPTFQVAPDFLLSL